MQISFIKRKVHLVYMTLGAVSMLLAGVSYVRAQETIDPMPPEHRGMMREVVESRRTGLSEAQQNRFINLVRNTVSRMEGAITRLENISGRLEARMAKLQAEGIDTTGAATSLAEAKRILAEATSALASLKAGAENGIISDTPRERFTASREEFITIRQSIRSAFILLRESVNELKDAMAEARLRKDNN
jgi:hypothetical protein